MLKKMTLTVLCAALFATAANADALKVVASFSIIGDMARQVGGNRVSVTTLVGPDSDAHVYEPKPQDAAAVAEADVVLVNGLGFEGFIQRLTQASPPKAQLVELTKGADLIRTGKGDHAHENETDVESHGADPHAFQSVSNARLYVRNIAEAFCLADADACEHFKMNASNYDAQLAALDEEIKAAVAAIPQDKRTVITAHDAFGYFAHAYGLTFRAPEGVSTEAEASAADVAKLIDQVRAEKASALFVENISDPRLITQIANEAGIRVGGALYSDALSAPDGPAATYIDMMRHNISTIAGAISGS
ncbi:MAG: zinc ABC transporter substrate-binding protein AztC [Rhizobiaceae bacterium]